jgi:hypothetical protein
MVDGQSLTSSPFKQPAEARERGVVRKHTRRLTGWLITLVEILR